MKPINEITTNIRLNIDDYGPDGLSAWLVHPMVKDFTIAIVASWGGGWDHVSASLRNRYPTWDEMCIIKDIFFEDEECVVQYHPPKSAYVNMHPFCLHMWREQGAEYARPPMWMVGVKV